MREQEIIAIFVIAQFQNAAISKQSYENIAFNYLERTSPVRIVYCRLDHLRILYL
jgi:hypothetical protein